MVRQGLSWGGALDMASRQLMEQDAEVEALTSRSSEHGPESMISGLDSLPRERGTRRGSRKWRQGPMLTASPWLRHHFPLIYFTC